MPHQCTGCGHVFPDGSKEMLSGCPDCGGNKFQFKPADDAGGTADPAEEPEPPDPPTEGSSVADAVAGATERVRDLVGSDDEGDWPAVGREGADGTPAARSARGGSGAGTASDPGGDPDTDPDSDPRPAGAGEDTAQASARSSVVDPDDLPDREGPPAVEERAEPSVADERPTDAASARSADPDAASDSADDLGSSPFTGSGDRDEGTDDGPGLAELREELNDQFESIRIVDRGQYELNLMELYDREEYIISLMEDGRYAIEVPEAWRDE